MDWETEKKIGKIILIIANIVLILFGAIFGGAFLVIVLIILGILDLICYFADKE